MAKTYILVDFLNMAIRAKNSMPGNTIDMQIGLMLHVLLNSIKYSYKEFNGDHLVMCLEGKSWRKKTSPSYKANRAIKLLERSEKDIENDKLFFEAIADFTEFLNTKTNASCLQSPNAEADDMIAIFIQNHPEDNHIIVSTDSDFYQLLAPNVKIYNGVTEQTITLEGFFDAKGKRIIDKKTNLPKVINEPEYILFEKCIRGDSSDNIFSAYPGARTKGTKTKVGILEAYQDRKNKGFSYNNFMLQKFMDENGKEHRVLDRYNENKHLIDLTDQPIDIKMECKESIKVALAKEPVSNIGIHFLRFCARYDLAKISKYPNELCNILSAKYSV